MTTDPSLAEVDQHTKIVKQALRAAGLPEKSIRSIWTKALKTGRKVTGVHATNRDCRWKLDPGHPQYGTEIDCKVIAIKLAGQIFCFDHAPTLPASTRKLLEDQYMLHPVMPGTYRDPLLLERFSFHALVAEGNSPTHGHSQFHLGHEDPTLKPKHIPENIGWRSHRSNLIQGDMTLRQARIYFVQLIGRYFDLGEIEISKPPTVQQSP